MNELSDFLAILRQRAHQIRRNHPSNEALVRNALVEPVLQWWGWDVQNPQEVIPEAQSNPGPRGMASRAVLDYVLCHAEEPRVIVEAKSVKAGLTGDARSQIGNQAVLLRSTYPGLTQRLLLVLTNGIQWELLWDDSFRRPFAAFDLLQPSTSPEAEIAFVTHLARLWKPLHMNGPSPEKSLSASQANDEPQGTSHEWLTITAIRPTDVTRRRPLAVRTPDGAVHPVRTFAQMAEVIVRQAVQRHGEKRIQELLPLPYKNNKKRYFLNTVPMHGYGRSFIIPLQVEDSVWMEKNWSGANFIEALQQFLSRLPDGDGWHVQIL